jgi:hypothetical protein
MARRHGLPLAVDVGADGTPASFVWRGERRCVQVIGRWKLATARWEPNQRVDRTYNRVRTADQQVFEVYQDT